MNYHIQGFSSFVYSITKHILEYKYILMILIQADYLYVSIRLNHCGSSLPCISFRLKIQLPSQHYMLLGCILFLSIRLDKPCVTVSTIHMV